MEIQTSLNYLDSVIGDPTKGLPEEVFRFASSIVPMINVDLLIRNDQDQTLLSWREDEFFSPGWHIPGGIIRYKETAEERIKIVAVRELEAEVACSEKPLDIKEVIMRQPSWRVRGHFISMLYECRLLSEPKAPRARKEMPPQPGEWDWHEICPDNLYESQNIYREHIK